MCIRDRCELMTHNATAAAAANETRTSSQRRGVKREVGGQWSEVGRVYNQTEGPAVWMRPTSDIRHPILVPPDPQSNRHRPARRHLQVVPLETLHVGEVVDPAEPLHVAADDVADGDVWPQDAGIVPPVTAQVVDLLALLRLVTHITTPVVPGPLADVDTAQRERGPTHVPAQRRAPRRRRDFRHAVANFEVTRIK